MIRANMSLDISSKGENVRSQGLYRVERSTLKPIGTRYQGGSLASAKAKIRHKFAVCQGVTALSRDIFQNNIFQNKT